MANQNNSGEKISVFGRRGEYPKFWSDGSLIQYWCDVCEQRPAVAPGYILVILTHDSCIGERALRAAKKLEPKE